jgi:hypothetical protein
MLRGLFARFLRAILGYRSTLLGHALLLLMMALLLEGCVAGHVSRGLLAAAKQLVQK